jgi:tRNA (guanine-N7-)-methyltransferase
MIAVMSEVSVKPEQPRAGRKLYGRRKGKALRASQLRLLQELLPEVSVRLPGSQRESDTLQPAALFRDRPARIWLEIGFGGGEHLVHQAQLYPEVGFLGCEPFVNGVAMLLSRLESRGLDNIRVHPGDARNLIDCLPAASIDRVFLLYPDPWPKTRHHRRRFMNLENLLPLARVMRTGADLRLATDIDDYAAHAIEAIKACGGTFGMIGSGTSETGAAWPDWPGTRYEAKAIRAGRNPRYLTFRKA